jgi:hypothetical protein
MITVSREYGALGGTVGRIAADRLGFQYFDREVVDMIAREARVQAAIVESVDEGVRDSIGNWLAELFGTGRLPSSEYLRTLSRLFLTAGHHGRGVIVGRGANFILDRSRTLAVRCIAPIEERVTRVARFKSISSVEALDRIREVDKSRKQFYRRNFDRDANDPGIFDLVLNTGMLTPEACADIVLLAFKARFGDKH